MKDRIALVRKNNKLNQEKFAESLNLSRNFINQIESGKKNPSDRTILDICREYNVNETWLRTGDGEMFMDVSMEEEIADLTNKLLTEESDSFKARLISALARLTDEQWDLFEQFIDDIAGTKKE